jgi:hypothetical protein
VEIAGEIGGRIAVEIGVEIGGRIAVEIGVEIGGRTAVEIGLEIGGRIAVEIGLEIGGRTAGENTLETRGVLWAVLGGRGLLASRERRSSSRSLTRRQLQLRAPPTDPSTYSTAAIYKAPAAVRIAPAAWAALWYRGTSMV